MSTINLTDTDPGEGAVLPADTFIGVYGGKSILDIFYPIGIYVESSDINFDPNVMWGGLWEEDSAGRVTVAQDRGTFAVLGDTGGEEKHKLVLNEIPSHSHAIRSGYGETSPGSDAYRYQYWAASDLGWKTGNLGTNSRGGDQSHNNLQPYIVVKRWHRIG